MRFWRLLLPATAALAAVNPVSEPPRARVFTAPLVPVAVKSSSDSRLLWVRLVFVPRHLRDECQGKMTQECLTEPWDERLRPRPRRRDEPDRVLDVVVGEAGTPEETALLRDLSVAPAVRELRTRKDAAWTPAGAPAEFPIDRKRVVRAELRWTASPRRETLEILRLR